MNIVCATDDNFVQHCCIMLVSLLENNDSVNIYILTEGLTTENENIIRDEVARYDSSLTFCKVDATIVEKFPMPKLEGLSHISRATYYRLLIADILPSEIEKAVYLDCDMIINGNLKPLWETNIDGYAIAAVPQIGYGFEALRLGYPIEYGYFNAGMNVINLNYWRSNKIGEKLINYISENFNKIKFHDQDALNGLLHDKTLHVLPQWNMTSVAYVKHLNGLGDRINGKLINNYTDEKCNVKEYKNNPIILHYVSRPKPWNKGCTHQLYHLYYEYAWKTIHFKDIRMENKVSRDFAVFKDHSRAFLSLLKQFFVRTDKTRY